MLLKSTFGSQSLRLLTSAMQLRFFESIQKWVQIYMISFLYICVFIYIHIYCVYDFAKDCLCVRMGYFGLRVRIQDITGKCVASSLVCGKQFRPPKIGKTESYHRE